LKTSRDVTDTEIVINPTQCRLHTKQEDSSNCTIPCSLSLVIPYAVQYVRSDYDATIGPTLCIIISTILRKLYHSERTTIGSKSTDRYAKNIGVCLSLDYSSCFSVELISHCPVQESAILRCSPQSRRSCDAGGTRTPDDEPRASSDSLNADRVRLY
jgi:hypothetical protein